ncbi:MAG TPA: hypothetical protein VIJ04_04550 [Xanthobacteraceae bacterium]
MVYLAPSIRYLLLAGAMLVGSPALAGDVTPDRLVNADKEPQNWLMNHRTYDSRRYSPLDAINEDNVKNLKLEYAVALGGTTADENLEATPLAEDGFLYVVDQWGVPVEYDPKRDIQVYSGLQNQTVADPTKRLCPSMSGGNNFWPSAYSQRTKLIYIPSMSSCNELTLDPKLSNKAGDWKGARFHNIERNTSDIIAADPLTGDIRVTQHIPYPNNAGILATAGGIIFTGFTDGTFAAYDDTTLKQLWKINVGSGFDAPPMTFAVNGKQYVAILSGLSKIAQRRHDFTPELKYQRNQTMLFVFGL